MSVHKDIFNCQDQDTLCLRYFIRCKFIESCWSLWSSLMEIIILNYMIEYMFIWLVESSRMISMCYQLPEAQWCVMYIWVDNLTISGSDNSDNGLSPGRRHAIIWTNAVILLIGPLGTNFSEIQIKIHTLSFRKMHFKMPSGKCWPSCLSLNVLITWIML